MKLKTLLQNKPVLIGLAVVLLLAVGFVIFKPGQAQENNQVKPTPKPEPVNIIPVSKRPYVTLQPKAGRNLLELVIHELRIPADKVEVTLEYDRNKGILDAVLRNFTLTEPPLVEELFLGSKSAGGHITYHDDVIGGDLLLEFDGDEPYALKVPWSYDDTQSKYQALSTADQKFQLELEDPLSTSKILIMQSPGVPKAVDGEVVAGPYLFRTAGNLPDTTATVKIRLPETDSAVTLLGYDGQDWQELDATVDGKQLTAENVPVYEVYTVIQ